MSTNDLTSSPRHTEADGRRPVRSWLPHSVTPAPSGRQHRYVTSETAHYRTVAAKVAKYAADGAR